jgi:predicted RNA-binding protein YlqC (UPF0109 family)
MYGNRLLNPSGHSDPFWMDYTSARELVLLAVPSFTSMNFEYILTSEVMPTFIIDGHPDDTGKRIGAQGAIARSIGIITSGVGKKLGRSCLVVVND